jgi:hypothetical protein
MSTPTPISTPDNPSYRGAEVLRQRALLGLDGHISYTFNNTIWASLDNRYSFRGDTTVSGVNQDNPQQNFILGSELVVSPNSRNSFTFEFAKAAVHKNGPSLTGFTVKYDYTWVGIPLRPPLRALPARAALRKDCEAGEHYHPAQ